MTIADIQRRLQALGHDPGPADGVAGPRTAAALEAMLRASGLPMRVTATRDTLTATGPVPAAPVVPPSRAPELRQGAARHPVREIVVHCAATRPDWMRGQPLSAKVAEIRAWHRNNGWSDIGYHWVIDRDGAVQAGRLETVVGAHVAGHNSGTIGICLLGGFGAAASDSFSDHFTALQDIALRQLISAIQMRARIERITGHNEYAAKACPGFSVAAWLKGA